MKIWTCVNESTSNKEDLSGCGTEGRRLVFMKMQSHTVIQVRSSKTRNERDTGTGGEGGLAS